MGERWRGGLSGAVVLALCTFCMVLAFGPGVRVGEARCPGPPFDASSGIARYFKAGPCSQQKAAKPQDSSESPKGQLSSGECSQKAGGQGQQQSQCSGSKRAKRGSGVPGKPPTPPAKGSLELAKQDSDSIHITSINVSALRPHLQSLLDDIASASVAMDACLVQEHCVSASSMGSVMKAASKGGSKAILGPAVTSGTRVHAGVGAIAGPKIRIRPLKPVLGVLSKYIEAGRLLFVLADIGGSAPILLCIVYAWTDAHVRAENRQYSCEMFKSICDELAHHSLPAAIVGDFNADLEDLDPLQSRIDSNQLFDLGALQHLGDQAGQTTCLAHGARGATRRDFFLANTLLLPWATGFRVIEGEGFDVHSPVMASFTPPKASLACSLSRPAPFECPPTISKVEWRKELEEASGRYFGDQVASSFASAAQREDVDGMWQWWSAAAHGLFESVEKCHGMQARAGVMHGKPKFRSHDVSHSGAQYGASVEGPHVQVAREAAELHKQARRVRYMADAIRACKVVQVDSWPRDLAGAWRRAVQADRQRNDMAEVRVLVGTGARWHVVVIVLRKLADKLAKLAQAKTDEAFSRKRATLREAAADSRRGLAVAFRCLRKPRTDGIAMVRGSDGRVTADPQEVDTRVREVWRAITDGNGDQAQVAAAFLRKYEEHLVSMPEQDMGPLTPSRVRKVLRASRPTAAGADGWAPAELANLPWLAIVRLTEFFNVVETTGKWPQDLSTVLCSFMAKEEQASLDPLQYRGISILATVYRLWAKARLADLQGWVEEWRHPDLFSGVAGVGAQDAWLFTAQQAERARSEGDPFAVTACDLYKCFDQSNRTLLYGLLARAGMPSRLLLPYMAFMENAQFRCVLSAGVGQPERRKCSIPQGCPWSMMCVGMLVTPWLRGLTAISPNVRGRALADDLLITTGLQGPMPEEEVAIDHAEAVSWTAEFVADIGALLSASKTKTAASTKAVRATLKREVARGFERPFPLVFDFRDLGSHLVSTRRYVGPTLSARLDQACVTCKAIATLPLAPERRAQVIAGKVIPAALYGCQSSPAASTKVARLRSAIVDTLDRTAARTRSLPLAFVLQNMELDPLVHILVMRASAVRRMWHLFPELQPVMIECLEKAIEANQSQEGPPKDGNAIGPVSLLLCSCLRVGLVCDAEWNLTSNDGSPVCNIMQFPCQRLKPRLIQAARDARQAMHERARQSVQGNGAVDRRITVAASKHWQGPDRTLVRRIQMMGVWTTSSLHHVGREDSAVCCHCNGERESWQHMWWECEAFQETRSQAWDGVVPQGQSLPPLLRNAGVAPALVYLEGGTLWGMQQGADAPGVPVWGEPPQEARALLERFRCHKGLQPGSTIRIDDFLSWLQGNEPLEQPPLPPEVLGVPPEIPNCFTDGSVQQCYRLGAAFAGQAAWCAHGQSGEGAPAPVPMAQGFTDFAFSEVGPRGTACWSFLEGVLPSSTRAEIAGLAMAMQYLAPVHIAVDNAAACKRSQGHCCLRQGPQAVGPQAQWGYVGHCPGSC